jgi:peptidoglycan/xylan/chitin deacetylase (PgdA/CDA1 family)
MRYSRRAFLQFLAGMAGAATLAPAIRLAANGARNSIEVPPTLMLHTKDKWQLSKILNWLADNEYNSINYVDLLAFIEKNKPLPAKPVILTIDDIGSHYIQPYFLAMAEMVEAMGYKGVFGVVTRESPARTPDIWAKLRGLAERGWEMDSHTNRHVSLPRLQTAEEVREEITSSIKRIEDGIGIRPMAMIAPYGNVLTGKITADGRVITSTGDFDRRIFDAVREMQVPFVVGILKGRITPPDMAQPYYVGRVGVGVDYRQTTWWLSNFQTVN